MTGSVARVAPSSRLKARPLNGFQALMKSPGGHRAVVDPAKLRDLPEKGLRKGDLGSIVQTYEPDGLEVEFVKACLVDSHDHVYRDLLFAAPDLRRPPTQPNEQEAPVLEELGRLALVGVAHELEDPPDDEQRRGRGPQRAPERRDDEQRNRQRDHRNAEGVEASVDRVVVALAVCGDPLVPAPRAHERHTAKPTKTSSV